MADIMVGSTVIVSNPNKNSLAYKGTIGKVIQIQNERVAIRSINCFISEWDKKELSLNKYEI